MIFKKTLTTVFFTLLLGAIFAQTSKPLRGVVIDQASNQPLSFANIKIIDLNQGTMADSAGKFTLNNLPVGRHDIEVSFMGYEPATFKEIMITAGKEFFLEVKLKENVNTLNSVVIRSKVDKEQPLNPMSTVSARMLSTEESSRYAGGFDDPARLVSSFAGVSGNVSSNGIAIRGNSPQSLQWRLEGVEIPNPTHFADITGVGGGILTALSNQVLGNSDFFTGAFPAEYNNALSGVFDMQMRNGNNNQREHTIQIGTLGIDVASEGPFKKGKQGSYLFNYRYSSMALMGDLLPDLLGNAAGMRYQDLSFKINLPTQKMGTFSVWGMGVIDHFGEPNSDSDNSLDTDSTQRNKAIAKQQMAAGGIGHKYFINNNTYIKTALSASYNKNHIMVDLLADENNPKRVCDFFGQNPTLVFSSFINKKFSNRHTNRTGVSFTELFYDLDYNIIPTFPKLSNIPMVQLGKGSGNTNLTSVFSNSMINITEKLTANIGLNTQFFALNKEFTIEPRLGLKWQIKPLHSLALAYGMHSRHEKIDYYFVEINNNFVNKDLKLSKAHHFVLAYDWSITPNLHLKIEPYFQYLYDVPVDPSSSFSIINITEWYTYQALVSKGKGQNVGIDFTLEKYLSNGYYYLITASVFDSRYQGGDGKWYNTRLNRNFLINALAGKEWMVGKKKQNILGANIRFTYQGGERYSPVNESASIINQDVVYDHTRAFEIQLDPAFISHLTVSYKINKKKTAHEFAFKMANVTSYKEFIGHSYNSKSQTVKLKKMSVAIPNISYKIEF